MSLVSCVSPIDSIPLPFGTSMSPPSLTMISIFQISKLTTVASSSSFQSASRSVFILCDGVAPQLNVLDRSFDVPNGSWAKIMFSTDTPNSCMSLNMFINEPSPPAIATISFLLEECLFPGESPFVC